MNSFPINHYISSNPAKDPNFEPERQFCGFSFSIFGCIVCIGAALLFLFDALMRENVTKQLEAILRGTALLFFSLFHILSLHYPDYLGGNPEISKLWPFFTGQGIMLLVVLLEGRNLLNRLVTKALVFVIFNAIFYLIYIKNDSEPNNCLCLKPWVYKRKALNYNNYNGYPPYGQYPQAFGNPQYGQAPIQGYPQAVPMHQPQQDYPLHNQSYPIAQPHAPQKIETPITSGPGPASSQYSAQAPPPYLPKY